MNIIYVCRYTIKHTCPVVVISWHQNTQKKNKLMYSWLINASNFNLVVCVRFRHQFCKNYTLNLYMFFHINIGTNRRLIINE